MTALAPSTVINVSRKMHNPIISAESETAATSLKLRPSSPDAPLASLDLTNSRPPAPPKTAAITRPASRL